MAWLVGGALALTSLPAAAAGDGETIVQQEESVEVGERALDQALVEAEAERDAGNEPAELSDLRESLIENSAADGTTLLGEDTTAFEAADGIAIASTSDVTVDHVEVVTSDDQAVAEVQTESSDSPSPDVQGMGMAWDVNGTGTFIIKLSGKGEMESRYIKSRSNESSYDRMSMRRKAQGIGYDVGGINWSVTGIYISSHVVDSDKQHVIGRWNAVPASDTAGNCSTIDLSLGIPALGMSFQDCEKTEIKFSASDPGYYAAYMKQGAVFGRGAREVGFNNVIKINRGKGVNYTHYQRLEMARAIYPADTCAAWDSNNTC